MNLRVFRSVLTVILMAVLMTSDSPTAIATLSPATSPTPTPAPSTSGLDLWSGFAGNLVAAVIGAAVSIAVAVYVLRKTLANDAAARKQQREADARDAEDARAAERAALQAQIDANLQRDRRTARERASLDAAEALTGTLWRTGAKLTQAQKAQARGERYGIRQEAFNAFGGDILLKTPAIEVSELRDRMQHGHEWVSEYVVWAEERDEFLLALQPRINGVAPDLTRDAGSIEGLNVLKDRCAHLSECLSSYRLETPMPPLMSLPLPRFDKVP